MRGHPAMRLDDPPAGASCIPDETGKARSSLLPCAAGRVPEGGQDTLPASMARPRGYGAGGVLCGQAHRSLMTQCGQSGVRAVHT